MLDRLYQWMLAKAAHRHAATWLFLFAFAESSFFPIPPHPFLLLLCLAQPKKSLWFGFVTTAGSVLGGLMGYAIGHFAFEAFGKGLLDALHLTKSFPVAACLLRENAAWIIIGKGATPIPFKLVTITAGFIGVPLWTFLWASTVSRGFVFMLVGALFWKFGPPIQSFIEKYLKWVAAGFVVMVVGGFLLAAMLGDHKGSDKCSHATLADMAR